MAYMAYFKQHLLRVFMTFALVGALCLFVASQSIAAFAAQDTTTEASYEFNTMLVVDSSGSIDDATSDPDNLRFDAVNLFYNLAPTDAASIGLIAFSNSNLFELAPGTSAQTALETLANTPVTGGTNIGSAVYSAVSLLIEQQAENGLPSQVLLLSDGETDLGDPTALAASQADFNAAIALAQEHNIPINVVWLNPDETANVPEEITTLTESTGGYYEQIQSADDLTTLFARFYALFTNVQLSTTEVSDTQTASFEAPISGIKELVFLVECDPDATITITSPTGEVLDLDTLTCVSMQQSILVKITDPLVGIYTFSVSEDACVTMLYNLDLTTQISAPAMTEPYGIGQTQVITLTIAALDGTTSSAVDYSNLTASIEVLTPQKETVPLETISTGSAIVASFVPEEQGYYYITATIEAGDVVFQSDVASFSIGNLAPTAREETISAYLPVGLLFSGTWDEDLSTLFYDNEDTTLSYRIVSVETAPLEATTTTQSRSLIVNNAIAFSCNELSSTTFIIEAMDSAGATAQVTVCIQTIPSGLLLLVSLLVFLLCGAAIFLYFKVYKPKAIATNYTFNHRIFIRIKRTVQTGNNSQDLFTPFALQMPFTGVLPFSKFSMQPGPEGAELKKGLSGLSFHATDNPNVCEIHSKTPFYWGGNPVESRSVRINLERARSNSDYLKFSGDAREQLHIFFSHRGSF